MDGSAFRRADVVAVLAFHHGYSRRLARVALACGLNGVSPGLPLHEDPDDPAYPRLSFLARFGRALFLSFSQPPCHWPLLLLFSETTGEQQARRAGGQNNNKAAGRHRCCEASESPEAGRQQRDLQ